MKPTPKILGSECWDCSIEDLEFVTPGRAERQRILAEKAINNFKRIVQVFLFILGLPIIMAINIIYNVNKDKPEPPKYESKLNTKQDLIDFINDTF